MTSPFGRSSRYFGWLYVVPALAFTFTFLFYPVAYNVDNSLSSHGRFSLEHFTTLFTDSVFGIALRNSILWVIVTTLAQMILGFILAYYLENYLRRFSATIRTIVFLPMAITPTVSAIVFGNIYAPQYGLIYGVFQHLGIGNAFPSLLGNPHFVSYAIMVVNVWQWFGFYVLMYSVGLAGINSDVMAAADVDGAIGWKRVSLVILPMLKSSHWSLAILGGIQALQQFPLIYLMTQGGPANSSQVLATYIFKKGFDENQMAYASAISIVLLVIALILAGIQLLFSHGDFSIGGGKRS